VLLIDVRSAVDRSGHNTVAMVVLLVSAVGGVFILFALMALCYRSVVVHRNFSLCLRLVSSLSGAPSNLETKQKKNNCPFYFQLSFFIITLE